MNKPKHSLTVLLCCMQFKKNINQDSNYVSRNISKTKVSHNSNIYKCYTNYTDIIELWQRGRVIKDPEKICSVRTLVKSA